jgi:predicted Zn-dependent protease
MVRADVLAVLSRADRAVEELRAALPLPAEPANSLVELRLASLQRVQGDSAAAAATLRDLLLREPDLLTAHELLTEIEFTQGEHDAALARLTGLAARHPDSKPARIVLVQTLLRMGRALEARPWLEQLTRLDPSDGAVWLQLGVICAASGDAAPARVALQRALALPLDEANRRLAREHLAGLPQR